MKHKKLPDESAQPPKTRPKRANTSVAADKTAKFKQEQHLQIDTTQDVDNVDEDKKAPPSSTSKKRRRRPAAEIDRKFTCQIDGCLKAYGTEGSLTHHQKLKHPDKLADEVQENQVGAFLLPLHHTSSRNVSIRPATPLVTFASDPNLGISSQSSEDAVEIAPPSAKAQRCHARLRSNSLPVASATGEAEKVEMAPSSNPIRGSALKPRGKTPRKPRRVATPHPSKVVMATRRSKSRSKSESLTEITPLQPLEEFKVPSNHRSDSTASVHEAILPINSVTSGGPPAFEWPPSSISGHHTTSVSSDDHAIDSDILSVLANCDADDLTDPTVLDFGGGPPSYQSSASFGESEDAEMLPVGMECFKIAEHSTLPTQEQEFSVKEPEAELGLNAFATLGDDWANATHLSTHLEKMSVTQGDSPSHHLDSGFAPENQRTVGRLRSASDPSYAATPMLFGMTHASPLPEPFSMKSGTIGNRPTHSFESVLSGQPLQNDVNFHPWGSAGSLEPTKMEENNPQQLFWLSSEANVATAGNSQPSSQALDELLQRDEAVDWKATNGLEGDVDIDYGLGDAPMTSALL